MTPLQLLREKKTVEERASQMNDKLIDEEERQKNLFKHKSRLEQTIGEVERALEKVPYLLDLCGVTVAVSELLRLRFFRYGNSEEYDFVAGEGAARVARAAEARDGGRAPTGEGF